MSRNAAAVGALVLVGGLLWLVTAWPTADDPADNAAPETPELIPAPLPVPMIGTPPKADPEPPPAPAPVVTPASAPAAPPAQMRAPHTPDVDMFAKEQGPVAEYKRLYETEPRDSNANETESAIRAAFSPKDGAPELFRSVLCRRTVCKLELRWSTPGLGAYVAGITRATTGFGKTVAVAPGGPMGDDGVRPIDVYIKRSPQPSAAEGQSPAKPGQPAIAQPAQPVPAQLAPPAQAESAAPAEPQPPAAN